MADLREAAQQALEALESWSGMRSLWDAEDQKALDTLRAALEQPEPEQEQEQEPVADLRCRHPRKGRGMKKPKPELTREQAWGWHDLMVISAFRYCVGRQTYVVQTCADWLTDIWPLLTEQTQGVIRRDLEEEFRRDDEARAREEKHKPLGWDCDRKDWERVRALWRTPT